MEYLKNCRKQKGTLLRVWRRSCFRSPSPAKGANLVIPRLKSGRSNEPRVRRDKMRPWRPRPLTFTPRRRSEALWRGCCPWARRPAGRLCPRSADSTAGALRPPGTPATHGLRFMAPLPDESGLYRSLWGQLLLYATNNSGLQYRNPTEVLFIFFLKKLGDSSEGLFVLDLNNL